jgi:hypothetical protein
MSHDPALGDAPSQRDSTGDERPREQARRALWVHELDEKTITALAKARMHPRHDHLNRLLDD